MSLASESYDEILTSCPLLKILRGGNCHAKVLAEGSRTWVCLKLRAWALCLDFGPLNDYKDGAKSSESGKEQGSATSIKKTSSGSTSSSSSSTTKNPTEEQEERRKEVYRKVFSKMSAMIELESVNLGKRCIVSLSKPLWIDNNDKASGFKLLLMCPRLKSLTLDTSLTDKATREWIKTNWPSIQINGASAASTGTGTTAAPRNVHPSRIEHDDFDDDDDEDDTEPNEYGYVQGQGPYCAKCDMRGCSHHEEYLQMRHEERQRMRRHYGHFTGNFYIDHNGRQRKKWF